MLRLSIIITMALWCGACATDRRAVDQASTATCVSNLASPARGVFTAGRLKASDLAWVRAEGIRHVIDLTEDAETPLAMALTAGVGHLFGAAV